MCKICGEDRAMMASRKDEKNSGATRLVKSSIPTLARRAKQ